MLVSLELDKEKNNNSITTNHNYPLSLSLSIHFSKICMIPPNNSFLLSNLFSLHLLQPLLNKNPSTTSSSRPTLCTQLSSPSSSLPRNTATHSGSPPKSPHFGSLPNKFSKLLFVLFLFIPNPNNSSISINLFSLQQDQTKILLRE